VSRCVGTGSGGHPLLWVVPPDGCFSTPPWNQGQQEVRYGTLEGYGYLLARVARCVRSRCARGWPTCSCERIARTDGTPARRQRSRKHLLGGRLQRIRVHWRPGMIGSARRCLGVADNHHKEFVRADQRNRRPRGHSRPNQAMAQAVRNVCRERRRYAQAEEPSRHRRDTNHGRRGRPPDDPARRYHRTAPSSTNSAASMHGFLVHSVLGHIVIMS
jgi:hypothetical protein